MKLEAIMHRCAGTECYAVSKDEICINLRLKYISLQG